MDKIIGILPIFLVVGVFLFIGCTTANVEITSTPKLTTTPENLPEITAIHPDRLDVPRYASIEFLLEILAEYTNPYDTREIRLDGSFHAPDGALMSVPGFWDGKENWRIRFTPWQEGEWQFEILVTDHNGTSDPIVGSFTVMSSDLHGWLQVGTWMNPAFSSRYLTQHDGTHFYGVGHCDALNILTDGFDIEDGVRLFNNMVEAGENYVVWWPFYTNSPVIGGFDDYTVSNLEMIDLVVRDAQQKGIFLIFTVWDHPQLRDQTHAWGDGRWDGYNGFRKLTDIDDFFTAEESWIWQTNLYRYLIARWGYSPAIGMWQTISEINGTNAYDQINPWHERVNTYFVENDPYRHPTTASMSGDVDWPEGHQTMDIPQVHVYSMDHDTEKDAVKAAETIAYWTELMWQTGKPNWIGEFGVTGDVYYPELFHNSIWAALGAGAAMTPAEWNSGGTWWFMTIEMYEDQGRLAKFVEEVPLARLNPVALVIDSNDPDVRGWGVAGENGGIFWVQDYSMQGSSIDEVRENEQIRTGVELNISGFAEGIYVITPYDTWEGNFLKPFEIKCLAGKVCEITLPEFKDDMAFKVGRK